MRKLILFLAIILTARAALAAPPTPGTQTLRSESGQVNIETGAAKNIELSTNNTKHWVIDGTTGNLTAQGSEAVSGAIATSTITAAGTPITLSLSGNATRLHKFGAASNTALSYTFGDAGATANQDLVISGSAADADDDTTVCLAGGGACSGTRGAYVQANGEQDGGDPGSLTLTSSTNSGQVYLTAPGGSVFISSNVGGSVTLGKTGTAWWTIDGTAGTLIGAGTGTIGWTVIASGAGVACTTACTTPCVAGQNATFGLVSCATAVTGFCICAGAS